MVIDCEVRMNQKGFTLVEIIGVLTILTLIVLVAFPNILGAMTKTEEKMDEATETLLITNAKNYWNDTTIMAEGSNYCVRIKTLIKQNYTKTPISTVKKEKEEELENTYCVTASHNGTKCVYQLTNTCSC